MSVGGEKYIPFCRLSSFVRIAVNSFDKSLKSKDMFRYYIISGQHIYISFFIVLFFFNEIQ